MANTEHRAYPLPDEANDIDVEFFTLMLTTLPKIDLDMHSLFQALAGKAAGDHVHAVADIVGLALALTEKMDGSKTFALSDLTDVEGSAEATDGYILAKVGPKYVAQSAAAALGSHRHLMSDVEGLADALDAHVHLIEDVEGLADALDGKAPAEETTAAINGGAVHVATSKAEPTGADEFGFWDSVSSGLRKLTWANLKAALMYVSYDAAQALTQNQKRQALDNIGSVWEKIAEITVSSPAASIVQTGLGAYKDIRISGSLYPTTAGQLVLRLSRNNGSSYDAGASDYFLQSLRAVGASLGGVGGANAYFTLTYGAVDASANRAVVFEYLLTRFNMTEMTQIEGKASFMDTGSERLLSFMGGVHQFSAACNAVQFSTLAGSFAGGYLLIEGRR